MLALGFDHVSDDDYARVTIAQAFAHAPRLDPTGTSWLPFPFWALGAVMMAAGRSLAVARVASVAFASAAAALPYVALRRVGATRASAGLAVGFAVLSPWNLWLGAATVPESFTASFAVAAAIALGAKARRGGARADFGFAVAMLAACLSRYEAWPVAAVLAVVVAWRGWRGPRAARWQELALAGVVAIGPIAWMAWNAHAHGDALHFFERVARYKRGLGEAHESTVSALLAYPRLLFTRRPDVAAALGVALVGGHFFVRSRSEMRGRWGVALACAAAQIAFLAYGNVRDGAPTHHPERALLGVFFITAACAADVLTEAAPAAMAMARARVPAIVVMGLLALGWLGSSARALRDVPGAGAPEDRRAQLDAGRALRAARAEHVEVTPCAYEHFALVAAFGAPERVTTRPPTGAPVTAKCPGVEATPLSGPEADGGRDSR